MFMEHCANTSIPTVLLHFAKFKVCDSAPQNHEHVNVDITNVLISRSTLIVYFGFFPFFQGAWVDLDGGLH